MRFHGYHRGEGGDSQLPVLTLVEDKGRVDGKEGAPVLVGYASQIIKAHLSVGNMRYGLALPVGEENGEDADGFEIRDSGVHLLLVGGLQLGL